MAKGIIMVYGQNGLDFGMTNGKKQSGNFWQRMGKNCILTFSKPTYPWPSYRKGFPWLMIKLFIINYSVQRVMLSLRNREHIAIGKNGREHSSQ